jgi:hypothetical protein
MIGADDSDSEMRKLALASMKEIEIKNQENINLSKKKFQSYETTKISKGNICIVT